MLIDSCLSGYFHDIKRRGRVKWHAKLHIEFVLLFIVKSNKSKNKITSKITWCKFKEWKKLLHESCHGNLKFGLVSIRLLYHERDILSTFRWNSVRGLPNWSHRLCSIEEQPMWKLKIAWVRFSIASYLGRKEIVAHVNFRL